MRINKTVKNCYNLPPTGRVCAILLMAKWPPIAPSIMNNIEETFSRMLSLIETAQAIKNELESLRKNTTDEEWDKQLDSKFGDLICYCMDLEHELDKE